MKKQIRDKIQATLSRNFGLKGINEVIIGSRITNKRRFYLVDFWFHLFSKVRNTVLTMVPGYTACPHFLFYILAAVVQLLSCF